MAIFIQYLRILCQDSQRFLLFQALGKIFKRPSVSCYKKTRMTSKPFLPAAQSSVALGGFLICSNPKQQRGQQP